MQTNLRRGKASISHAAWACPSRFWLRSAFAAGDCAPERALAACRTSGPAGVHAAAGGTGVRAATTRLPTSASGGGGTLGCAGGSSGPALHGLAVATSGRVLEGGRPLGGASGNPCEGRSDEDHERQRAFARRQACASRLT